MDAPKTVLAADPENLAALTLLARALARRAVEPAPAHAEARIALGVAEARRLLAGG